MNRSRLEYACCKVDFGVKFETYSCASRSDEFYLGHGIPRTEVTNATGEIVTPGRFVTKDTILEIFDALAESIRTGTPYQTRLDPPPADPCCCHPAKVS